MINPETETGRLLRNTAILLNSVAEAAWANGIRSPAKWVFELERARPGVLT